METLKQTVLKLCNTVTGARNAGIVGASSLRNVMLADGTIGQMEIKVVIRESEFQTDFVMDPDFDVLKESELTAIDYFAKERARHEDLGHTAEMDDRYQNNKLAIAAAIYALDETTAKVVAPNGSDAWPLNVGRDKRDGLSQFRKLEIAGALLAGELDTLIRKSKDVKPEEES